MNIAVSEFSLDPSDSVSVCVYLATEVQGLNVFTDASPAYIEIEGPIQAAIDVAMKRSETKVLVLQSLEKI
jgi:hypothetical protein